MEVDIGERMNYVRTDQLLEKEPSNRGCLQLLHDHDR